MTATDTQVVHSGAQQPSGQGAEFDLDIETTTALRGQRASAALSGIAREGEPG
jgi:hypothetical protein